jgi:hypothetical protein
VKNERARRYLIDDAVALILCTVTILLAICVSACNGTTNPTTVKAKNGTTDSATVHVSFGTDSKVTGDDWSFCTGEKDKCSFALGKGDSKPLPTNGKYLNATLAFDKDVGCGTTKAEVNVNNPKWYDILDVSLVDGYNKKIKILATPTGKSEIALGPPDGQTGNDKAFGVFPYGCDICVERQSPPCGIAKGKFGCKEGTQYDPDVPCQWQGTKMGGGDLAVTVELVD